MSTFTKSPLRYGWCVPTTFLAPVIGVSGVHWDCVWICDRWCCWCHCRVKWSYPQVQACCGWFVRADERTSSLRSYLKAVENLGSSGHGELDRSKPFVPNLESSSQLDDSSTEGTSGVVIDATPLPVRRKGVKRAKKEAASSPHKDENKEPVSPFPSCVWLCNYHAVYYYNVQISLAKKFAYSLRSRKKQDPTVSRY